MWNDLPKSLKHSASKLSFRESLNNLNFLVTPHCPHPEIGNTCTRRVTPEEIIQIIANWT